MRKTEGRHHMHRASSGVLPEEQSRNYVWMQLACRATFSWKIAAGFSGSVKPQSSAFDPEKLAALLAAQLGIANTSSDRDSHGVSDPSGRARDGSSRAWWGRSRHGLPLAALTLTVGRAA
jgi:hypothetical protein